MIITEYYVHKTKQNNTTGTQKNKPEPEFRGIFSI